MLPDGNGSQVLKRIKSHYPDVQVCLTTGCSSAMIDPLRKDVAHVFTKPLDVTRLMKVLCAQAYSCT